MADDTVIDGQGSSVDTSSTEIVPSPERDATTGRFAAGVSGNPAGKPRNSLAKFTKLMKTELADIFERSGEKGNPLAVAHSIMLDEANKPDIRLRACDLILSYVLPKKHAVELEAPDGDYEEQTVRITEQIRRYFTVTTVTKEG